MQLPDPKVGLKRDEKRPAPDSVSVWCVLADWAMHAGCLFVHKRFEMSRGRMRSRTRNDGAVMW